jgi:hypothetical protein
VTAGTALRTGVSAGTSIRTATARIQLATAVSAVAGTAGGHLETIVCAAAVAEHVVVGVGRAAE